MKYLLFYLEIDTVMKGTSLKKTSIPTNLTYSLKILILCDYTSLRLRKWCVLGVFFLHIMQLGSKNVIVVFSI